MVFTNHTNISGGGNLIIALHLLDLYLLSLPSEPNKTVWSNYDFKSEISFKDETDSWLHFNSKDKALYIDCARIEENSKILFWINPYINHLQGKPHNDISWVLYSKKVDTSY